MVPEIPDIFRRYGTVEPCPKGSMDQPDLGVSPRLFFTHWCPETDKSGRFKRRTHNLPPYRSYSSEITTAQSLFLNSVVFVLIDVSEKRFASIVRVEEHQSQWFAARINHTM
jgi:hypothetical protein